MAVFEKKETAYKRKCVYSNRYKKGVQKQISLSKFTEDEADNHLLDFVKRIKDDNDKFKNEKNKNDIDEFESGKYTSGSLTMDIEGFKNNLVKINIEGVFEKFDTDLSSNVLIIANSKCGKTYLLKEFVNNWSKKRPEMLIIWMIGNKNAEIYTDIIDRDDYIFIDGFRSSLIETIHIINNNSDPDEMYEFLFVIDDIVDERNSTMISNLAMSYRNCKMNSIFTIQDTTLIMPKARDNSTVQIFGASKGRSIIKLHNDFLRSNNLFRKYAKKETEKINMFKSACQDYHFLVSFPLENDGDMLYDLKVD